MLTERSGRKFTPYVCGSKFCIQRMEDGKRDESYMSKKENYESRTEKLLEPLLLENNFELVDVEYIKEGATWYLRIYIDKEGGITVDDCELISRALSDLLDEHDFIPDAYILEVSSPGLGRQLKKDKDFARSIGEEVEIKLYKSIKVEQNGKTISIKELFGVLTEYDSEKVTIELEDGEQMDILRSDIAIIRLALDF